MPDTSVRVVIEVKTDKDEDHREYFQRSSRLRVLHQTFILSQVVATRAAT